MQKALSTAYLNHQISELESRVHAIDLPNGHHDHHGNHERIAESASSRGGRGRCGGGFGRRHGEENGRGGHEGGLGRGKHGEKGRIDDSDEDRDQEVDKEWRVVVVDVSALLWAPKAVKRVMGKGWEVILPLEGMTTCPPAANALS